MHAREAENHRGREAQELQREVSRCPPAAAARRPAPPGFPWAGAAMEDDDRQVRAALAWTRGGCRQRRQRAQATAAAELVAVGGREAGPLGKPAYQLVESWCWGELSAVRVQCLALCAVQDGCAEASLARLSKLGAEGAHAGNCHRDLLEFLRRLKLPRTPEAVVETVPLRLRTEGPATLVEHPYMPLHRLFAHMFQHWPSEWRKTVFGQAGQLGQWWAALDKGTDPRWQEWQRALRAKAAEAGQTLEVLLEMAIPLALHADAVRVFKRKNLNVLSAASLVGSGGTKELKLMMHCYWANLVSKGNGTATDSEQAVWQVAQWDLTACFSGRHPTVDHKGAAWQCGSEEAALAGTAWGGGAVAVPWICRADLDQYSKVWKLENIASNSPCPWCRANRSTVPWTDFGPEALWKRQCWQSDALWRAAHPARHPMWDTLQMGLHSANVDGPLHTLALGVAQHVTGNVLYQLVYEAVPAATGTVEQRLALIFEKHPGALLSSQRKDQDWQAGAGILLLRQARAARSLPLHDNAGEGDRALVSGSGVGLAAVCRGRQPDALLHFSGRAVPGRDTKSQGRILARRLTRGSSGARTTCCGSTRPCPTTLRSAGSGVGTSFPSSMFCGIGSGSVSGSIRETLAATSTRTLWAL